MENNLIVVKQLPIIEDQLRQVKASVDERVENVLALACTEETYKDVKKARAELNKEFQDLETRRREVKKSILAPYEAFERLYKECAADAFTRADAELKSKIAAVEGGIKAAKRDEITAFFNEYRATLNLPDDIAPFEWAGINVTMSDSMKKLQEKASAYLEVIKRDLRMIEAMEHKDEIMVEFRRTRNASQAILIVNERHKQMEEAARRREAMRAAQEAQMAAQAKIEEVMKEEQAAEAALEPIEQPAVLDAPISEPVNEPVSEPINEPVEVPAEKVYRASFHVHGTIAQLRALKEFLVNGGYSYEQF